MAEAESSGLTSESASVTMRMFRFMDRASEMAAAASELVAGKQGDGSPVWIAARTSSPGSIAFAASLKTMAARESFVKSPAAGALDNGEVE
ncbi:hypothetical protein [Accumulibacter sp.]|uniref:hypothetical protein n=1 Tax=Accumulibacter sp. TaxID=2053492 RepID=UPI0025DD0105|nr:hypothetical protein [Accumulibacter sp.]MCM8613308.1 hypothetical protein [Accumulibacter sp.]MCM8636035.1 hypothetical protein [Accumulibacter sp.]MCM8640866.1 hypothetical protein [Accumulibacter sp.]